MFDNVQKRYAQLDDVFSIALLVAQQSNDETEKKFSRIAKCLSAS